MRLEVRGHIYNGQRCSYSYEITPEQAKALQAHTITATSLAGDFSAVTAWRLRDTVTAHQQGRGFTRQLTETRTVASRNWRGHSCA